MIGEEASGPAGEMGEQAGDHRRKLGVVMLQFAVHQVELVGQRGENDSQRRKNDKTDNDDGHQRREAIALPRRVRILFLTGLKITARIAAQRMAE